MIYSNSHGLMDFFVGVLMKMLCDETFPGEMQHTCLLTPDREPQKDQSIDTTKVQFGEPMDFTGASYRSMGKALLTGAEMSQK